MTDLITIDHEADTAIFMAGAYANPTWLSEAESAVLILCKIGNDFTTDQIHELLLRLGITTPEPRALGSVIRSACRDGHIKPAGYYRKSERRACHRRPLAVWRPVNTRRSTEYGDSQ